MPKTISELEPHSRKTKRVPKPEPPVYSGIKIGLPEKRAILEASTSGFVFRASKLGMGPDKKTVDHRSKYVSIGVLAKLCKCGVMTNGEGYGTYVLTEKYKKYELEKLKNYDVAFSKWRQYNLSIKEMQTKRKAERGTK